MNYVSPSYDAAMRHPIRATAYHGCEGNCQQGHKACDCSLGVAPIKSSTPRFPDMPISMEESSPLANWRFWAGGAVSVLIWTLFCYGVYWIRN